MSQCSCGVQLRPDKTCLYGCEKFKKPSQYNRQGLSDKALAARDRDRDAKRIKRAANR